MAIEDIGVDEMGGTVGIRHVLVRCDGRHSVTVTVPFSWKRTSWFSSTWLGSIAIPLSLTDEHCG